MKLKKNIFVVILFVCFSVFAFGQSYGNYSLFSFCKHKAETISFNDLQKCKTLVSKNKNLEIKSFIVSIFIKVKSDTLSTATGFEEGGLYREYKIMGNALSKEALDFFKQKLEEKEHLKVEITDIIALENGKEGKYDGFVFYLH